MKRWNQKGSFHAHRRMAELRARKESLATQELGRQWRVALGIEGQGSDALGAALKSAGFPWGQPQSVKQDWYRAAIAKARGQE